MDSLTDLVRGPFYFVESDSTERDRLLARLSALLPLPQRIFLEDEEATPVCGYPVMLSTRVQELPEAVEKWVSAEGDFELAHLEGRRPTRSAAEAAWESYSSLLTSATENSINSSFGRGYPAILWLFHSIAVSRVFKESPRRSIRKHLEIGRRHSHDIKYRIFNRYVDRVLALTHDVARDAALRADEDERDLFPAILSVMRDNVLILTEDHVGADLKELEGFFAASLRIDPADLRSRLQSMVTWHTQDLSSDQDLRGLVRSMFQLDDMGNPRELLIRPGYVRFLSSRADYTEDRFLTAGMLDIWDGLLIKLKEFELLASIRRLVIPIRERNHGLTCSAATVQRTAPGRTEIVLSDSTRPLDFSTAWVVDPVVRRYGLIYDITDFSAIISVMRRSASTDEDLSFRQIFAFQRQVSRMARDHKLQLEKYLGDGALYSGRHPRLLLVAAVKLQRYYRRALEESFPFNRGVRLALNYGRYRLLPIEMGGVRAGHRYEFFGHGIVELSRLVTGKRTRELEEVKTMLISYGYDPSDVEKFFEPVARKNVHLVDRAEEKRQFYAYINENGTLINEGIVATEHFVGQLDSAARPLEMFSKQEGNRRYIVFDVEGGGETVMVGLRKLGSPNLKGLGKIPAHEVVDAEAWRNTALEPVRDLTLRGALDRDYDTATGRGHPAAQPAELG